MDLSFNNNQVQDVYAFKSHTPIGCEKKHGADYRPIFVLPGMY